MPISAFTFVILSLFYSVSCSTLTAPPLSALVVAFESIYDLSLVANSLSDQGIDASLLIPSSQADEAYENLIDVDILSLTMNVEKPGSRGISAIRACESLLTDDKIRQKIQEIQPAFVIFPALRHDACLLPWAKSIGAIPVLWVRDPDEELYAFERTGVAIPIHTGSLWSRLSKNFARRSILSSAESEYVTPTLRLIGKHFSNINVDLDDLYSDVHLVLWGSDTVLRSDFASLTHLLVEIGCHHCRGAHPLPAVLHKPVIEYRLGAISILLDDSYETLVRNVADRLPQGREGQAIIWKNKDVQSTDKSWPENVFIHDTIDRQDLIGYSRTRVLLSHCTDTELLEAAFHGTPVICFPRNSQELRNAVRAVELGFAAAVEENRDSINAEELTKLINTLHQSTDYRENARKVSLAIRDRPDPAVDRLIFWLRYTARTEDGRKNLLTPKGHAKSLAEDSQLLLGFFLGCLVGIASVTICFFVRYTRLSNRSQISKGRYAR